VKRRSETEEYQTIKPSWAGKPILQLWPNDRSTLLSEGEWAGAQIRGLHFGWDHINVKKV